LPLARAFSEMQAPTGPGGVERGQHFPCLGARAPARGSRPEIKGPGRPTRSSGPSRRAACRWPTSRASQQPGDSPRNTATRSIARARVEAGNQRPWPADKVERSLAAGCLPLAYIEGVSAARRFAEKHGYALNPVVSVGQNCPLNLIVRAELGG
jgi:hypothetical protein